MKNILLHQMLDLTLKMDQINEEWFKEYIEHPSEHIGFFKDKQQASNSKAFLSSLRSVMTGGKFQNNIGNRVNGDNSLIYTYLKRLCVQAGGSL